MRYPHDKAAAEAESAKAEFDAAYTALQEAQQRFSLALQRVDEALKNRAATHERRGQ